MKKNWPPLDQAFWYTKRNAPKPCRTNLDVDIAIIGGGMAGLSAAQAFSNKGKQVVLLEQYYCGSGATGKSSGFITPNAELSFTDFIHKYNETAAHTIWDFITCGVNDIRNTIHNYNFTCDYEAQDTLIVATSKNGMKTLETEYNNLSKFGYNTSLYNADTLQDHIGSKNYLGGLLYADTFSINGYLYCQEMKKHLEDVGVVIFEETPVTGINNNTLTTAHAHINAKYIIICGDRFIPELGLLRDKIYHVQTFILLSQQLTEEQIKSIFPKQKKMVWDTHLIYNYFRLTHDNRLLIGGGNLLSTYSSQPDHNYERMVHKLEKYCKEQFPNVSLQFEYIWPGLIGISKDIVPIAGFDKNNKHIYYVTGATGLPIAAALGRYSAEHILEQRTDLDVYFSPYRSFRIEGITQSLLGTRLSFALSHLLEQNVP
jgi:gamma-glutamylputrescine oxidase